MYIYFVIQTSFKLFVNYIIIIISFSKAIIIYHYYKTGAFTEGFESVWS